jgi:hypothetical protein
MRSARPGEASNFWDILRSVAPAGKPIGQQGRAGHSVGLCRRVGVGHACHCCAPTREHGREGSLATVPLEGYLLLGGDAGEYVKVFGLARL